ncbi:MAG: hypothetical protein AB7F86_01280 [Bdellovibrionales bacterium]
MSDLLNLVSNPVSSYTVPAIFLDAISISIGFESNVRDYARHDLPSEFSTRIVNPHIQFGKNGIATVSGGSMISGGKRLLYKAVHKAYPNSRRKHHNLLSSSDKIGVLSLSNGKPYLYQNQLLFNLVDDLKAHCFSREIKLNFIDGDQVLNEAYAVFVSKFFPEKINYIEYCMEFPFQVRPDVQLFHVANAISGLYGATAGIHGHPGNTADLRWTVQQSTLLSGTELIQIKAYPKDFPDENGVIEQVYRVEVRFVKPRVQPNEFGHARDLKEKVEIIANEAAFILNGIYQRCQAPRKLHGYKEIEQAVLCVLKRSRNDKRIVALIESLMECGAYTPSYHKTNKVPVYHLRKLVAAGVLREIYISKQRKSYILDSIAGATDDLQKHNAFKPFHPNPNNEVVVGEKIYGDHET